MKSLSISCVLLLSSAAWALPCFHPGKYEGKGVGLNTDSTFVYQVTTDMADAKQGTSTYIWAPDEQKVLNFRSEGDELYFENELVGKINCGLGETTLEVKTQDVQLNESWVFVGNYLLRNGQKVRSDGNTIKYQELLIRTK